MNNVNLMVNTIVHLITECESYETKTTKFVGRSNLFIVVAILCYKDIGMWSYKEGSCYLSCLESFRVVFNGVNVPDILRPEVQDIYQVTNDERIAIAPNDVITS